MKTYTIKQADASPNCPESKKTYNKNRNAIPATPEDGHLYREWGNYFTAIGRHVLYSRALTGAHFRYFTHVCSFAAIGTHSLTGDLTRKRRYAMAARREAVMMGVSVRTIFRWRRQLREVGLMTRAPSAMYEPAPHWINKREADIEAASGLRFRPRDDESPFFPVDTAPGQKRISNLIQAAFPSVPLYDTDGALSQKHVRHIYRKEHKGVDCALIDAQIRLEAKRRAYHSGKLE